MSRLMVVCLISGGKDSLFSILHCLENGHDIVALANLHPPDREGEGAVEDLDSYMYQTVGHAVIPIYEQALGLPLYRQPISGFAANQEKCYGPADFSAKDETEDLTNLLRKIKDCHPEVNAVSSGAILSDYQRTRVESVATRLGLTPLSYLWQWPSLPPHSQTSLLEDMAAVGQDSRIVKVASGGLDESFLWQDLADPRTVSRLDRAVNRFGSGEDGAVLGEGGEFETLAVAGPAPLWKGRIVVDRETIKIAVGEAGSASVHSLKARVEPLTTHSAGAATVRVPRLLEPWTQTILDSLGHGELGLCKQQEDRDVRVDARGSVGKASGQLLLSNLTCEGSTAAEQMQTVMKQATESLRLSGHHLRDVAYTSIILRDMAAFPEVNAVYGAYFTHPNPPARVTVACVSVLPTGMHLMVSMTSVKPATAHSRNGLHVQSRSYWAPANIGPYSQAISTLLTTGTNGEDCGLAYIAGQVPLVPASMELPVSKTLSQKQYFALQAVLGLQHLVRIGNAMRVRCWVGAIAFIVRVSSVSPDLQSEIARGAWDALHTVGGFTTTDSASDEDNADDFDVWDAKYGAERSLLHQQHATQYPPSPGVFSPRAIPPLYVIQVDALPKGASIEWVTYGLTGTPDAIPGIPHFQHLLLVFQGILI